MGLLPDIMSIFGAVIRLSAPLLLASMGGLFSERAGIVDIGLEGKMLVSAFAAASAALVFNSPWIGLLFAIFAGVFVAIFHGIATVIYRGDHVVSALSLNFIASGITVVLVNAWFGIGPKTPNLNDEQRFHPITLPFTNENSDSTLQMFYSSVISGHSILIYLAFLSVPIVWFVLQHTRFGLRLRAVGEEPNAVDSAGVNVIRQRLYAVMVTGVLCGIAGALFSISLNAGFSKEMTAGSGYIALAAVVFGKWRPLQVMATCLLFGFLSAMETRMYSISLPWVGILPPQAFQALPYVLTVILLAGFIGKAIAPKALGRPYIKEG